MPLIPTLPCAARWTVGTRTRRILHMHDADRLVAGVDLGGTHVSAALADLDGNIVDRATEPVDRHAGADAILAQIAAMVQRLAAAQPRALRRLAIGCPGIIAVDKGMVLGAANLDGWRRVPVRDRLEAALRIPVRVENDVNLGALGEGWRGAAQGMRDYVFLALGTGIGGGVVVNGQLVRGAHGFGGEIAYLVSEPGLLGGDYQDRGNLEAWIGAVALERRAAEVGIAGGPEALFQAARLGQPAAVALMEDLVRRLAAAVMNIAALVDPEAVIIGGGLSLQGEALLDPLRRTVASMGGPPVTIIPAALGQDAQLYGAIFAALNDEQQQGSAG
jgi:glucokinase